MCSAEQRRNASLLQCKKVAIFNGLNGRWTTGFSFIEKDLHQSLVLINVSYVLKTDLWTSLDLCSLSNLWLHIFG